MERQQRVLRRWKVEREMRESLLVSYVPSTGRRTVVGIRKPSLFSFSLFLNAGCNDRLLQMSTFPCIRTRTLHLTMYKIIAGTGLLNLSRQFFQTSFAEDR